MPAEGCPEQGRRATRGQALLALSLTILALSPSACGGKGKAAAARPAPGSPRPAARAEASGYELRPAERDAINAFLRRNPALRVATDDDRRTPVEGEDVRELYGVYHPYFVRGDVNDDGILDFVVAFVRRDSDRNAPWFFVVVFTGREGSGFGPETILERDVSLADGDLSVDRNTILITPDLSEDATRRYRWDPVQRSYVFVGDAPEEGASIPLDRT